MALLRPSELARAWELHPRTVNLWIREGKLPAIKTPGAQYRVRSDDARAYCEKHDLPMPREVASPKGTVAVIGRPGATTRAVTKAARARGAQVMTWVSALEGLLGVAGEAPNVVALDGSRERLAEVKLADAVRALRRSAKTASTPVVVFDVPTQRAGLAKLGVSIALRGDADAAARIVTELLEASSPGGRG